jgi:cyclopropane fatty-acyl-phospholipid synthase-like methyltransferase
VGGCRGRLLTFTERLDSCGCFPFGPISTLLEIGNGRGATVHFLVGCRKGCKTFNLDLN